ncbi:MAG: PTS sugar transporter subunit IIA [Fusobacterium sp.]|nr:PTS sugar transporter subunit IIA [Fusobacterium sp.]
MKFSNYLDRKYIFIDLNATTKEEIIEEMLEKVSETNQHFLDRKEEILKSILKREDEISTCMGEGIFLPHARIKDLNDFVIAVGIVKNEVMGEIGGTKELDKIKLVFLIISDVLRNKNILRSMSVISKLALRHPEVVEKILNTDNKKEIVELISVEDAEIEHRMIAEDVLGPAVKPVREDDTLEEVAKRLVLENQKAFPVVGEDGKFLGEITEKELIAFGMPDHLAIMNSLDFLTVGEPFEEYLLNEDIVTIENIYRKDLKFLKIDRQTPIMEICFKMVYKGIHRLYVVDNDKYYGTINRSDIIKKVLHI